VRFGSPPRARRWSSLAGRHTAIGAVSFLALEASRGSITINYGLPTRPVPSDRRTLILLTSLPIAYSAVHLRGRTSICSRAAGFGYVRTTLNSLSYASSRSYLAIEAAIVRSAMEMASGYPLFDGYVLP